MELTDKDLLPSHYTKVDAPFFQGKGNLNVLELEELCSKFEEYCHQQSIIKYKLYEMVKNQIANPPLVMVPPPEYVGQMYMRYMSESSNKVINANGWYTTKDGNRNKYSLFEFSQLMMTNAEFAKTFWSLW